MSLLFSCGSNDSERIEPIVGQWVYAYSTRDGVITNENSCLSTNSFTFNNDQSLVYMGNLIDANEDCTLRTYDVESVWIKREDNLGVYYSLRGKSSSGGNFNYTYSHVSVDDILIVGVREDGITAPNNRVDYYNRLEE